MREDNACGCSVVGLTRHWSRRPTAFASLRLSGAAHRQRSAAREMLCGNSTRTMWQDIPLSTMDHNTSSTWLPEPSAPDDTYAGRDEHALDWLARSTIARAKACRRFLNEHLSKLPAGTQRKMLHDLRYQWHSTFFELIVARLLQE